jgi:hypothetical protein
MIHNETNGTLRAFYETVQEIKAESQGKVFEDAKWSDVSKSLGLQACSLHQNKQSTKCRQCKGIEQKISEILAAKMKTQEEHATLPEIQYYRVKPLSAINSLLTENVHSSEYYKTTLLKMSKPKDILKVVKKEFDSYSPWISIKKGLPSKFWSCLVRFAELEPKGAKIEKYLQDASKTRVITFLAYFIRFTFLPLQAYESLIKLANSKKMIKLDDKKQTMLEFITQLLQGYKIQGLVVPEISLTEARKINWKLDNVITPESSTGQTQ